jgi:glycosyltransferase involved in cell wall biosynthesis
MLDGADNCKATVRRVLHVSPYIHPAAGGPPVVVERWAEFAGAHGWHTRVLSTPALSPDDGQGLLAAAKDRYELFLVSSALDTLWGAGRANVHCLVQEADIVHLHTMWSPLNAIVASVCRRIDKPYVISPHGMLDPYSLSIKSLKKRLYLKVIERRTILGSAGVLFTADDERDLAIAQIGHVPNPGVVGLGADAPDASDEILRSRFRSTYPELADKKLLIFLGRLHPKKRPDVVIRAMRGVRGKIPDTALLVVGDGQQDYVDSLKQLAESLELRECVHFLGLLRGEEKWAALASSSVFALPSLQENFAIAVAEALQLGVPVLITDKINIWHEIVGAEAGILLRGAFLEDDLAHHAVALLSDPHNCRDMGRQARALALRAYTWPTSAQKLSVYYDAVLEMRRATRLEKIG